MSKSSRRKLIMHLDGDAFFVSVEMAKNPALRGKAVVTGRERGIASALSYEAKKLGITRAMPVFQIRKQFPQVFVVNSDYEAYAVFSKRMMDVVRRYAAAVKEYSIDECFADFSGVPGFAENPHPTLARIKEEIVRELGISVSLGLGPTKVIAKTASKSSKPDGLVMAIDADSIEKLLSVTLIQDVWGIGPASSFDLRKKGISTALEFIRKPREWIEGLFPKPLVEIWYELNGISVKPVGEEPDDQKSISKTRTFSPASSDTSVVFSELVKNTENACRKARELGLAAREMGIFLKTKDFSYRHARFRFVAPTNDTFEVIRRAGELFRSVFDPACRYRATGVTLSGLVPREMRQEDLFGYIKVDSPGAKVLEAVDAVNRRYGRNTLFVASASKAHAQERGGPSIRLRLPILGDAS